MAQVSCLCALAMLSLGLGLASGGMDACYDPQGRAQRCMPTFENAAFGKEVWVTNTCGSPPEDYCLQMGARDTTKLCHRCDAGDPLLHHNATYLTDFHSQEDSTWWQSQSMAFGIQHPNSVNLTLHLGKSYEITYVRLKFHTSRPESFAIYKRSRADGPWIPYQYYSASCGKTYRKQERQYLRSGEDEQVAFCTEEFSDISPLSGGNVAFSTLEGRPSAYSFDKSPVLQEWVTATALLISLNRLNTFGDDIFKDPKVLQSYYYAISDFSVGGRCKCNGHASQCAPNEAGHLVCLCQHNTTGVDCEQCRAFYQDRPWARGTAESANECLPCNCSGRSVECFYDRELYRSTGHGGHCLNCQDNTAGPHCERCQQNYYRWDGQTACQPCNCNTAGSLQLQCDSSGACECKAGVTGWKCERCQAGFHSLSAGGCRPCACDPAGSVGTCDPSSGRCACKERVEGYLCDRCQPGSFNLQPHNPAGCSSCFCYGHSTVCRVATHYEVHHVRSDFSQGPDGWTAKAPSGKEVLLHWAQGEIYLEQDGEELASFIAPEKFLQDQRLSYRQLLSLLFQAEGNGSGAAPFPVRLVLEGDGIVVSASYTPPAGSERQPHHGQHKVTFRLHEEAMRPLLSSFGFQRLLSNLTALKLQAGTSGTPCRVSLGEVQLSSARPGRSQPAPWVEECVCPQGYTGQFCESCAPGFKRAVPLGGPFTSCIPCTCNQHGSCDPDTGHCQCLHHTEGPSCERCAVGFHGNPFRGHVDDCQPCPCPGRSPCTALPGSGEPACTHCPGGQRGRRCELCDDGFFGDPLGEQGPALPCSPCQCNGNVDPNAVGNCDPVSGQCLRCLYDTMGAHCERCREGFYGSALAPSPAEKCAPCKCDAAGSALGAEPCDPVTGQCTCLPHVTGRDCSHCQPGYYDLQPETGCKSCECHPVGSQASLCHPLTGQCPCQPGVAGRSCDRCQPGFFGFSVKGCRACNCSPLGAATPQCHENSTCLCRPGFVGYKCHQCQVNFFNAPPRAECQACPVCYSLVQEEADKLTAKLQELEVWLQRPDCSSPGTHYAVLGEEPHGDRLQPGYQLPDAKAVFLEQVAQLESSVSAAWGQLRNASGTGGCDQKTCLLLSEISARLQSAQQEIQGVAAMLATMVVPQDVSEPPASWSHQALEAQKLAASHRDTAAQVESVARRALLTSNLSHALLQSILEDSASLGARNMLEDRYQAIQRVQQELAAGLLEGTAEAKRTFASIRRANAVMGKNLSRLSAVELDPLVVQTDVLTWELVQLEQGLEGKERLVVDKSGMLMAEPRRQLQRAELCQQLQKGAEAAQILAASSVSHGQAVVSKAKSLLSSVEAGERMFVHQKGQAAVRRKLAILRDRVLLDAQKKIRQAERMLGNSVSVSTAAKKTVREADGVARENAKRSQAVRREGKQQHKHAGELAQRVSLTLAEISRQEHVSEGLRAASQQATVGLSEAKESLQEAQRSLQVDIETLNNLLSSLDTMEQDTHAATVLSTSRLQLDRLWLRLARPGALERKLSHLQREAEQQRQKIRAFENDLQEIRADKQNLEEVLQSLPEGCSSWQ